MGAGVVMREGENLLQVGGKLVVGVAAVADGQEFKACRVGLCEASAHKVLREGAGDSPLDRVELRRAGSATGAVVASEAENVGRREIVGQPPFET